MSSTEQKLRPTDEWKKTYFPRGLNIDPDAWRSRNVDGSMPISLQEFSLLVHSPENTTWDDSYQSSEEVNQCYKESFEIQNVIYDNLHNRVAKYTVKS